MTFTRVTPSPMYLAATGAPMDSLICGDCASDVADGVMVTALSYDNIAAIEQTEGSCDCERCGRNVDGSFHDSNNN